MVFGASGVRCYRLCITRIHRGFCGLNILVGAFSFVACRSGGCSDGLADLGSFTSMSSGVYAFVCSAILAYCVYTEVHRGFCGLDTLVGAFAFGACRSDGFIGSHATMKSFFLTSTFVRAFSFSAILTYCVFPVCYVRFSFLASSVDHHGF